MTEQDHREPSDDDDVPWAAAENQDKYAGALGPFVVAYNRLDYMLGDILDRMVHLLGREDLAKRYEQRADLWFKLELIDLLASTRVESHLSEVPVNEIRRVHRARNVLVHSHYDGNPFDDSYVLIPQGRKARVEYLSPEEVQKLTELADECHDRCRTLRAALWFTEPYFK